VNGAAAVYAETAPDTDSVLRPTALGGLALLQLRTSNAPSTFSWELGLAPEQELVQLSNGSVAVFNEPSAAESLGAPLSEEVPGAAAGTSSDTGAGEEPAPEGPEGPEGEGEGEEAPPLEPLPPAPTAATAQREANAGELQPQDTEATYEAGAESFEEAEQQHGEPPVLVIQAPTVRDAAGNEVPAALSAEGDTVTLTVQSDAATTYPLTAELSLAAEGGRHATAGATPAFTPRQNAKPAASRSGGGVKYGLWEPNAQQLAYSEEKGKVVAHFDSRLKKTLHMATARLALNYNTPASDPRLKEWVTAARDAGLEPMITLQECESSARCTGKPPGYGTSLATYRKDVEALMRGLPSVKVWGAWNEPDNGSDPLHPLARAETAAYLWQQARLAAHDTGCKCKVVAGEFAEFQHTAYILRYVDTILKKHRYWHGNPGVWGLHDYRDLVEVSTTHPHFLADAAKFMHLQGRLGHPQMWITETGVDQQTGSRATALAHLKCKSPFTGACKLQELSAKDFLQLGGVSGGRGTGHPARVYYSLYRGPTAGYVAGHKHAFDSALLEGEGAEPSDWRPAYCVLAFSNHHCGPEAVTKPAVAKSTSNTASKVAATIDPRGLATSYWIEYGTSTAYGKTTARASLANELGPQSETVGLSHLQPCTTYHYQAVAENESSEGEPSLGGDKTVTTTCGHVTAVAAGWNHACQLLSTGTVECWGDNAEGQLGDGTRTSSEVPVTVSGISTATSITAGENYSCATLKDGAVECWGGPGATSESGSLTPKPIQGISGAVSVTAAGEIHACAISSGQVNCWGANNAGQAPGLVEGLGGPAEGLGGGVDFTCALLVSGSVDCWGDNSQGELGNGTRTSSEKPVRVSGISDATSVSAAGESFVCASLADGHVECWGSNYSGELGDGETGGGSSTPVRVTGISDALEVSAGENFACAVLTDGHVECWGANERGQLGDGGTRSSSTPVLVNEIENATSVAASGTHACALIAESGVSCWGTIVEPEEPPSGGGGGGGGGGGSPT
jgi:hypothetical protein